MAFWCLFLFVFSHIYVLASDFVRDEFLCSLQQMCSGVSGGHLVEASVSFPSGLWGLATVKVL